MSDYGKVKGEICGRNGCLGIIDEHERPGECACHINPPCSHCTAPVQFCPECGWDAEDDEILYMMRYPERGSTAYRWKTPEEAYRELPDGEFNYVHTVVERSFSVAKGKHPGFSKDEICRRVGCADKYSMPNFKHYDENTFEVSYFTD